MGAGRYGEAETIATGRGTAVQALDNILEAQAGKVRLLRRDELDPKWAFGKDARATVWEACQHLIRRLETDGEAGAAELLATLGSYGDRARDLAYRLYAIADRKGWTDEARSYNGLVTAWSHVSQLAPTGPLAGEAQFTLPGVSRVVG